MVNSMVEKSPNALSDFTPCLEVLDLGDREVRIRHAEAGGALTDVDEAIRHRGSTRGRSKHAANDAEDGGVGADAERQRHDDGQGKARGSGQGAKGEFEVGHQAHVAVGRPAFGEAIPFTL